MAPGTPRIIHYVLMKKALCALLLLVAVDAAAAVSYRLDGSSGMSGRVLADGPRIRIDFDNGTVLLTSDGGKTLAMLEPAAKTYTSMTAADLAGADLNVSNPKSTARDLGDGGALEGYPTRKWQVDTTFDVTFEPAINVHIAMRTESWRTERLPEAAASIAMGPSTRTGVPALDKLLETMSPPNVKGFPLKEVTTIRTGTKGGQEMTETWTVEAHEIRMGVAAAPAQFAIPTGYRKK
jgi:hypothetical protein